MATKKTKASQDIYQIKVVLVGTQPTIWRQLLVPGEFTLGQLHYVLQAAMGWENSHLHEFRIGDDLFGSLDPDLTPTESEPCIDENGVRLCDVLNKPGATAQYTYDLGDDWEHSITVEQIVPAEPGLDYPRCVGGERHCPPEDCGGVGGFYDFLKAIRNPKHEEHEEKLDWVGGSFDPDSFSIDAVNKRMPKPSLLIDWN